MGSDSKNDAKTRPLHVVLIDDEPFVLRALTRLLRGHRVECASNYEEAIPLLEGQCPDLIVSDSAMPGKSGMELLVRARDLCPESIRVMLSGTPPPEAHQLVRDGVLHGVFVKPWRADIAEALLALVERKPK